MNKEWRQEHRELINDFLEYLNNKTDQFILKGGTALMTCYGLDRFSEDIDLDGNKGRNRDIDKIIVNFCNERNIEYNHNKNTNTTNRYLLHYNGDLHPLKIETSFREGKIDFSKTERINNISVYNINSLTKKKLNAFNQRDKIRDMYDVIFLVKNYWEQLTDEAQSDIKDSFVNKGIDYFEMLLETQSDELIDKEKLQNDFIDIWDKVELSENDDDEFEDNFEYDYDDIE